MQGVYRVRLGSRELLETFVAAPGPAGWRYFGRAHEPETGRDAYQVDHLVDTDWNLVRFRWREPDGAEVVAVQAEGGIEVWSGGRSEIVPDVEAVWSSSPSSLLVIDRIVGTSQRAMTAVSLQAPFDPRSVVVRFGAMRARRVSTTRGDSSVREVRLEVDGRSRRAIIRSDLPLRVDEWFDLVE